MNLTRHLSYANVASTLAVVLVLGGGGAAVAAGGLGKNTVGSKQIKPAAVKLADLAPGAVDSSKIVDDSVSGTDVAESTLGKVPSAATADLATSAGNVLRAFVQADGTVVPALSSTGVTSSRTLTGRYGVVFPRPVAGCTSVASSSIVAPLDPPLAMVGTAPLEGDPKGVFVLTSDKNGDAANRSFGLVLVC